MQRAGLTVHPILLGAAFTREERSIFGLEGMLPYEVHGLDIQCQRAYEQLHKQPTVLLKQFVPSHASLSLSLKPSRLNAYYYDPTSAHSAFLASMRDQNQVYIKSRFYSRCGSC